MARHLIAAAFFVSTFLVATSAVADETAGILPPEGTQGAAVKQLQESWEVRGDSARQEYDIRLAEYQSNRCPANLVLQSNKRLLHAALMSGVRDAVDDYDRRASRIESMAERKLELRTGTEHELKQARAARVNALLKELLEQKMR